MFQGSLLGAFLTAIISNLERSGRIDLIFIFTGSGRFTTFFIVITMAIKPVCSYVMKKPYFMRIKKIVALLLILAVAGTSAAQKVTRKGMPPIDVSKDKTGRGKKKASLYQVGQFNGKWQETYRTDNSNNLLDFTDTLYLHFPDTGRVVTRNGTTSNMRGDAAIADPDILLAAADVYTIVSLSDSIAVLDNQEGQVHTMKRTNHFHFENYGKTAVKQEAFSDPVPVTLTDVLGKWMVYRKTAKPGAINPPVNIITYLKITDSTGENTANGEVTFYQTDRSMMQPCAVKVTNAGLDITAGECNWQLFIYKASKKELVFGDVDVLLYYAKSY